MMPDVFFYFVEAWLDHNVFVKAILVWGVIGLYEPVHLQAVFRYIREKVLYKWADHWVNLLELFRETPDSEVILPWSIF